MKFLASSAALFIWAQAAVCGLAALAPVTRGEDNGHEYHQAEPRDVDPSGTHPHPDSGHHGGAGSNTGSEDHCDLVARTLSSISPTVEAGSAGTLPASISLQADGLPTVHLSARGSLRAPPKAPDLIVQNASFRC